MNSIFVATVRMEGGKVGECPTSKHKKCNIIYIPIYSLEQVKSNSTLLKK